MAASPPANCALSELHGVCLRSGFVSPLKNGAACRCRGAVRPSAPALVPSRRALTSSISMLRGST